MEVEGFCFSGLGLTLGTKKGSYVPMPVHAQTCLSSHILYFCLNFYNKILLMNDFFFQS